MMLITATLVIIILPPDIFRYYKKSPYDKKYGNQKIFESTYLSLSFRFESGTTFLSYKRILNLSSEFLFFRLGFLSNQRVNYA